jgi:hypothetical protein
MRSAGRARLISKNLSEAIHDPRLIEVIGRHFQLHAIPVGQTDEAFAHLAGNVGEYAMLVAEFNAEHSSGEHGSDFAFGFDYVINCHRINTAAPRGPVRGERRASSQGKQAFEKRFEPALTGRRAASIAYL